MNAALLAALLPPACLPLLALALLRRRAWAAGAIAFLLLLGLPLCSSALLGTLGAPAPGADVAPGAIIVLPGPAAAGDDAPDGDTLLRLRAAAEQARRTGLPVLVAGSAPGQADAMADSLAHDFQVRPRWREDDARNPWQLAAAAAGLLRGAGIDRALLVAQPWEFALATRMFRRAGVEVQPAPVRPTGEVGPVLTDMLPRARDWMESLWALEQWLGLACEAVPACRGRVGYTGSQENTSALRSSGT